MKRAAGTAIGGLLTLAGCGAELAPGGEGEAAPPPAAACEATVRDANGNVIILGDGNVVRGEQDCDALRGDGVVLTQTREVDGFAGVSLANQHTGILARGPQALRLHYDQNLLPQLMTHVERGVLSVTNADPAQRLYPSPTARVEIAAPLLDFVETRDAARVEGEVWSAQLVLAAHGSSLLTLQVGATGSVYVTAAGASRVTLAGASRGTLRAHASGAATLSSVLVAEDVEVRAEGAAHVVVIATHTAVVSARGSAMVTVRGNPATRRVTRAERASIAFAD